MKRFAHVLTQVHSEILCRESTYFSACAFFMLIQFKSRKKQEILKQSCKGKLTELSVYSKIQEYLIQQFTGHCNEHAIMNHL